MNSAAACRCCLLLLQRLVACDTVGAHSQLPSLPLPPPLWLPQVAFRASLKGGDDFRPQQAFLRLTHAASGAAAYFAAVRAKDGSLYATAKSAEVHKQVGGVGVEGGRGRRGLCPRCPKQHRQ